MKKMYNIPVITIKAKTIPEAWEKAVLATWKDGIVIRTEYDQKDDPPSKDCTMIMVIEDPFAEPRIHRAFPGGLNDLEEYRQEVVDGIHDYLLGTEGGWHYTYHERIFAYQIHGKKINQIDYIVQKLSEVTYSRRAQAITWYVDLDPPVDDAPCLQRIWCRVVGDGELALNMNTHWRSRDGYKAAFMNIFALTDLQRQIAQKISENIGREVKVGRYVDIADSFHIYGSYYEQFEGFLKTVETRTFEERTWNTEFAEPIFEEERIRLEKEMTPSKRQ
jgi:thymidylate synthase